MIVVLAEASTVIAGLDDVAVVGQPVEQPVIGWVGDGLRQLLDTSSSHALGAASAALLLDCFGRPKPHFGSPDRFADRLRVRAVVF